MAKTSRESFRFMLRLPDELKEGLQAAAQSSGRTMTAEIIARLEESVGPANPSYAISPARERMKRAVAEMKEALNELQIAESLE